MPNSINLNLSQYLGDRITVEKDALRLVEMAKRCWLKDKTFKRISTRLVTVSVCDDTIFVQTNSNNCIIAEVVWNR